MNCKIYTSDPVLRIRLTLLILLFLSGLSSANQMTDSGHGSALESHGRHEKVEEVIVEGGQAPQREELGLSSIELSDEELTTKLGATLGETLADEPGVHNASYGPGVGLPVLRGLSGVRVQLSEDGIGAWDASAISPDHATSIEPVIAESIRVVKGPATVLQGNNAIGGTVEVKNGRITSSLKGQRLTSVIEARRELTNDHDRESYAGKIRMEEGHVVMQFDGFVRRSGDMDIPEYALQPVAIEQIYGFTTENIKGTVLNTDSSANNGSFAASFIGDNFYVGISTTSVRNEYGIPPGAHTDARNTPVPHVHGTGIREQARVRIDLDQHRHLFKWGGSFASSLMTNYELTVGKVEYKHLEFEQGPDGKPLPGTNFDNEVVETKIQFDHQLLSIIGLESSGKFGIHSIDRSFKAVAEKSFGAENFVPETDLESSGVFFYEDISLDVMGLESSIELGGRYERQKVTQLEATAPLGSFQQRFFHQPITYRTHTLSAAYTVDLSNNSRVIVNLNAAERAPDIQELLSLGAHLATRSYDVGLLVRPSDKPPEPEKFDSAELRWEWQSSLGEMNSAIFYTEVDDFIYQDINIENGLFDLASQGFTGTCARLEECIARYDYRQQNARLKGYEWQWYLPKVDLFGSQVRAELFSDYVRGQLSGQQDLPRMPPRRKGIGFQWQYDSFNALVRYTKVSSQRNSGEGETETSGYELLNVNASYTIRFNHDEERELMIFLQMKNLLDTEIRKSTSFLRNFTPEPGEEISMGMRFSF